MAETGFLDRNVRVAGREARFQVYVPPEWSKRQAWPVILFLHGSGERGRDGILPTQVGLGSAIRRNRARFKKVLVVFPQSGKQVCYWNDRWSEQMALAALEQTVKEFRGDRARLYLAGLSMGGYGALRMASKFGKRFAAMVAVCGGILPPARFKKMQNKIRFPAGVDPYAHTARGIGKLPSWIFHGRLDDLVPVTESRQIVRALKAAGGNVRYTEFPKEKHGSWGPAFDHPELLPWLLRQRKRMTEA